MKRQTRNTLIGSAYGVYSTLIGFSLLTWQFWVGMAILIAMQISASIED